MPRNVSKPYRVQWEIDEEATGPEKAALAALEVQRRTDGIATVFTVVEANGRRRRVDVTARGYRCSLLVATYGSVYQQEAAVYSIIHRSRVGPVRALRRAVDDFLRTPEGRRVAQSNGADFNWGDAVQHVPPGILVRRGVRSFESLPVAAWVDHDENLYRPASRHSGPAPAQGDEAA